MSESLIDIGKTVALCLKHAERIETDYAIMRQSPIPEDAELVALLRNLALLIRQNESDKNWLRAQRDVAEEHRSSEETGR